MKVLSNIARGKGQAEAQKHCGYGSIRLRRDGDFAVVEVECEGEIYEVIREYLDGQFCHTVEPLGILEVLEREATTA